MANLVPDEFDGDRFNSPEEVGLNLSHLPGEMLGFFFGIEGEFVEDLACSELLCHPHCVVHITLPTASLHY
jgi:hypothetical protein